MEKYKVLITSIGSTTSIGVIKFIRKCKSNSIFIFGTDINEEKKNAGSALVDKFYKVPSFNNPDYLPFIKNIVRQHGINIIVPIHDYEIEVLSCSINEFAELGCKVIVSSYETVKLVNDKFLFENLLSKNGILSPKTYKIGQWQNQKIETKAKWVLKPMQGVGSKGIYIGNRNAIDRVIADKALSGENYIIQEFIEGTEYTVDMFIKAKKATCIVPRIRVEVREGLCYKASTESNREFVEIINKIISHFDFYGPINIQFIKQDISGDLYCIECNPRFGGSSVITLYAGINLFDFILEDMENQSLQYNSHYKEIYMNRYWEEVYYEK